MINMMFNKYKKFDVDRKQIEFFLLKNIVITYLP